MTYLHLAVIFLAISAVPFVLAVWLRRPGRTWWIATGLTLAALMVLTAVFDNLMIYADLFRYPEENLSGVHVGLAPIEDFAWPLAATLLVPALTLLWGGNAETPSRRTRPVLTEER